MRRRGGVRCLGSEFSQGLFIDNPANAPLTWLGLVCVLSCSKKTSLSPTGIAACQLNKRPFHTCRVAAGWMVIRLK